MIEQALYQHLQEQEALLPYLAEYAEKMAIFSQEAPVILTQAGVKARSMVGSFLRWICRATRSAPWVECLP